MAAVKKYKLELEEYEIFRIKNLCDSYKHLIKAVPGSCMDWMIAQIEDVEIILNNASEFIEEKEESEIGF